MKIWYKSKQFWVNVIAIAAIIVRSEYGLTLTPMSEVAILAAINLVLRIVTKEPIVWKK